MSALPPQPVILELNSIDELFNAPAANPFSTHAVEILGQAGIDLLKTHILKNWPRLPGRIQLTLRLPAEQVTPELEQKTRLALQRYCAYKIDENSHLRRVAVQVAWRQLALASLFMLLVTAAMTVLARASFAMLPPFLSSLLSMLVWFAVILALFGSMSALVYGWIPFMRENAVLRHVQATEIAIISTAAGKSGPDR